MGSWADRKAQLKAEAELSEQGGRMAVAAVGCWEKAGYRKLGQVGMQQRLKNCCVQKCMLLCKTVL